MGFAMNLLLQVYESYTQSRLDCGIMFMIAAHRFVLTKFKGYKIMPQGWWWGIMIK